MKFELNNEIESLSKEIADIKKSIDNQNSNIIKELAKIENSKVN